MTQLQHAPAHLLIGPVDDTHDHVTNLLQQVFCSAEADPCTVCIACRQVRERQHYAVTWIVPEKTYTTETLEPIFDQIAFALEPDSSCFFVIDKADTLSLTCANSLLKVIEEPPRGYHFIFLAQQQEAVLSTIRSRCLIERIGHEQELGTRDPLLAFFLPHGSNDPIAFLQVLQKHPLDERLTQTLIDELLIQWTYEVKEALKRQDAQALQIAHANLEQLRAGLAHFPMPGSSKLFWKNLFLLFVR